MNNVLKKGLVIALALSMSMSAALPAFAADKTVTAAAPVSTVIETTSSVKAKAKRYFVNYVSGNISADSFLDKVAAGEKRVVVDIRDAADYAKGHVKGAVNIPYGVAVAENLENLPTDRPVYVYCYSGQTASQTIAIMRLAGIEAYNVSGGWNNGISKSEKAAKLTTTKEKVLRGYSNDVDNSVVKAAEEYYELAVKNGKFNISNTAAQSMIANDEVYLLDVRSENDHLKEWIAGVDKNIPFGEGMGASFSKLPKDKKILVQCYSGQTASQTSAILRMLGYESYTLSGGTNGWKSANLPMEKRSTQEFLNKKVENYFANLPADKNNVSAAAFLADAKTPKDCVIIDIRDKADYDKGHVRSAINVPYGVDIVEALDKIPNNKTVYVYCYSGQTASQTMMLLNLAGKQAKNVSGGWNNGISKVDGYKDQLSTGRYTFKAGTYAVDADIKAAIKGYYEEVAKEQTNKKGNISVANAEKLIGNPAYQFVDVRSAADYAKGHIEGAINVPYGKDMHKNFSKLPKNKTLILNCYSGQTASQAMAALEIMGYEVYNLSGGMNNGWLANGKTLVK